MEDIFARIRDVVSFCSSAEATLEKVSDALVTMLRDYEASQGLEIPPLKVEQPGVDEEHPGDVNAVGEQPGVAHDHEEQPGEDDDIEVQHGANERPLDKVRGLTLKRLKKFGLRVKGKSLKRKKWAIEEMTLLCLYAGHFKKKKSVSWTEVLKHFKTRPERGLINKWQDLQKTENPIEIECKEKAKQLMAEAIANGVFDHPK